MDETKLFDIRWRAFTKGNQHLVAQCIRGALADTGNGGLINYGHFECPLLVNKARNKPGDENGRCAGQKTAHQYGWHADADSILTRFGQRQPNRNKVTCSLGVNGEQGR